MQSRTRDFLFHANFNFGTDPTLTYRADVSPIPLPGAGDFLLLDGTNFLLLDGTNFLLL